MKIRVQFTPVLTAALLCAAGWYTFWLLAFRPALRAPILATARPSVTRLAADDETLSKLKTPTLFALPSRDGFSGGFLDNQITLHSPPEKTNNPARYLPRENAASPNLDQSLLTAKTVIPQSVLPTPGAAPHTEAIPVAGAHLFLSPELKQRYGDTLQLSMASSGLPETVRVDLTVRPDGTIEHALFETPVTNTALLSAIRQLRFKPAMEQTDGWLDIRFVPERKNNAR